MNNKTKVFISYSWDSEEHQNWVLDLAKTIDENGGQAIVDRTHLKYGGHIKTFMIKSISEADLVLMILTPNYRRKADNLEGGAGYEYNIINDDLFKMVTNNEKYIPILREGSSESSVTSFLAGFNYVDLRESNNYQKTLNEFLTQILKQPEFTDQKDEPMENEYAPFEELTKEMNRKAHFYFEKLYSASKVNTITEWDNEILTYNNQITEKFNPGKMLIYEDFVEDFKRVFGKELWTVKAALTTTDPDLARYKMDYKGCDSGEIYDTILRIMNATHDYIKNEVQLVDYNNLKSIEDLRMEYLNEDAMFLNKIIGFGIRSEILHRYYPAHFPIMTQKSLWGMYFLCDSANEFITIEQRRNYGMRVSHNWQYPYDRFTYLMTSLANNLREWFASLNISLKDEYRFGYVNMFLASVQEFHKSDIKLLHAWDGDK